MRKWDGWQRHITLCSLAHAYLVMLRSPKPPPIMLTPAQRDILQRLARRHRSPQRLVRRVRIILEAASGVPTILG